MASSEAGTTACRLDVAEEETGVEQLLDQLQRVVSGVCVRLNQARREV